MLKKVPFPTIEFNMSTQFSAFGPIDRTLPSVITPSQSGPGSDGNEELLGIP